MKKIVSLLIAAAFVAGPAFAGPKDVEKKVVDKLGGVKIDSVTKLPVGGLYEVVTPRGIIYTDEGVTYLMVGRVIETGGMKDLTTERMRELEEKRRIDFSSLPFDLSFKIVKGDGKRKIAVFSDPDCPFCKRMEQELKKVDNVTIYTFLMPLDQLHPNAPGKANAVWCSKDRAKAWLALMDEGKEPKASDAKGCAAPLEDVLKLAQSLGIQGTPGLVFGSGRVVPGLVPADRLEKYLDEQPAKKDDKKS